MSNPARAPRPEDPGDDEDDDPYELTAEGAMRALRRVAPPLDENAMETRQMLSQLRDMEALRYGVLGDDHKALLERIAEGSVADVELAPRLGKLAADRDVLVVVTVVTSALLLALAAGAMPLLGAAGWAVGLGATGALVALVTFQIASAALGPAVRGLRERARLDLSAGAVETAPAEMIDGPAGKASSVNGSRLLMTRRSREQLETLAGPHRAYYLPGSRLCLGVEPLAAPKGGYRDAGAAIGAEGAPVAVRSALARKKAVADSIARRKESEGAEAEAAEPSARRKWAPAWRIASWLVPIAAIMLLAGSVWKGVAWAAAGLAPLLLRLVSMSSGGAEVAVRIAAERRKEQQEEEEREQRRREQQRERRKGRSKKQG